MTSTPTSAPTSVATAGTAAGTAAAPGAPSPTLLPTSVIGSWAWPAWLHVTLDAHARGALGVDDVEETQDDAVDLAIRDQEDAGVDVITDGEMRRVGFFTASFYEHLTGLEELPPRRKVGVVGHDQRESYVAIGRIEAPKGLGLVAEHAYLSRRTARAVKTTCPGPYTLAGRIQGGAVYKDRMEVAHRLAQIVNTELRALAAAGARFIQLDEPSYAVHPDAPREFVELFNASVAGLRDGAGKPHGGTEVDAGVRRTRAEGVKVGIHFCFGNYVGRPVARRTYRPLFPHILDAHADQFALEFANRELAELDLWSEFPSDRELAAGLVDVKNYYVETAEEVAARIRAALKHVSPEKLTIVPDCGFSQTARWAAKAKLRSMVEGVRIVRQELAG